jgi:hypothetical protein
VWWGGAVPPVVWVVVQVVPASDGWEFPPEYRSSIVGKKLVRDERAQDLVSRFLSASRPLFHHAD